MDRYCTACGRQTLQSTERWDFCDCGYKFYYRDAYAEIEIAERTRKLKEQAEKPNDKINS
jgi:hypothetical protein